MTSLTKARNSLKLDFNKFIRLRDTKGVGCECVSCGKYVKYGTQDCQAGHFYPGIAIYRAIEFDEKNVNVQCFKCNYEKQGTRDGYKIGLEKKYGKRILEKLEYQSHNQSNLDVNLCQILKKEYKKKWKILTNKP